MSGGIEHWRGIWPALTSVVVVLALILTLGPARSEVAAAATPESLPPACTPDVRFAGAGKIEFVVWCGVRPGRVRFQVETAPGVRIDSLPTRAGASGEGAAGDLRCRRAKAGVTCSGRSAGPLTVRGELGVAAGDRCEPIRIKTSRVIFKSRPLGCPGVKPEQLRPRRDYYLQLRLDLGLDAELGRNRRAIERRIDRAIANWHRGEPVARVTDAELGAPLLPSEERSLEFREELLDSTVDALERWVPVHAADTYAGYAIDVTHGAIILRVGFTGDQEAQLEAFKREVELFAPALVQPFLVQPLYSERRLTRLQEEVIGAGDTPISRIVTSAGVNVDANRVEVGTEHVAEMKRVLLARFGTLDPFLVVLERPGTFL